MFVIYLQSNLQQSLNKDHLKLYFESSLFSQSTPLLQACKLCLIDFPILMVSVYFSMKNIQLNPSPVSAKTDAGVR